MNVALYARVSTDNQDLEMQKQKLVNWAEDNEYSYELFEEQVSSIEERQKFEEIMDRVEEFDMLVVTKIDRFARSLRDFLERINYLRGNGVEFRALDQPINTEDEMYGEFMLNQLALFAELERKMIRRRMQEGFEKAKEEGRVGRPRELSSGDVEQVVGMYKHGSSYRFIANRLGVSEATVYRALKEEGVVGDRD